VRSAQLAPSKSKASIGVAHLVGTMLGVGAGLAMTLVSWGQVPIEVSGAIVPLARAAPVHPIVFEPKPLIAVAVVDGEMSRERAALASIGPLMALAEPKPVVVAKRVRPKPARARRDEAPVPPWLTKRRR
jgi:hypothetical protein